MRGVQVESLSVSHHPEGFNHDYTWNHDTTSALP